MEKYRGLFEEAFIFLLMSVFTAMKQLINREGEIDWTSTFAKVFTNLVAGVGIYSFLLSYKDWYGQYPQKVGVIMFVVYSGSRIIDLFVDKFLDWLRNTDFKDIIRKIFNL